MLRARTMAKLAEAADKHIVYELDEKQSERREEAVKKIQRAMTRCKLERQEYKQVWFATLQGLTKQREAFDAEIARKLGLDRDECCVEALKELRADVAAGHVDIVPLWDQVVMEGKQVFGLKKKKIRLEVLANGMELRQTHSPFTSSNASPSSPSSAASLQPPASHHAVQHSCALRHVPQPQLHDVQKDLEPEERAKTILQDMLQLSSFDLEYFQIAMPRFEKSFDEHDSRLPGLVTTTEIMVVPIFVLQPFNLAKLGLPHGASFSVPGERGSSLWNWPHMEASPPSAQKDLRRLLAGQLDKAGMEKAEALHCIHNQSEDGNQSDSSEDEGHAMEWLCQEVFRGRKVRASWLRRPHSRRDPMLLLVHGGLQEAGCLCPMAFELAFSKGSGATDPAAQNIRDALGDYATHITGDAMSQSSTPHGAGHGTFARTHREWHLVELKLPRRVWGLDCRAGEASVHSLRELLREAYAAEMRITACLETGLDKSQLSGGARSRVGEDARDLLADFLGGRGPLTTLISVTNLAAGIPGDASESESSDILNVPLEALMKSLADDDPLPRHACQRLPGVAGAAHRDTPTEELLVALEELADVVKKLKARQWYGKNPWKTRCCLIHGSLDTGNVLVGGLRQLWVAGLSGRHPCVDNALRDLADFSTSLLLEDCQLPVVEQDLAYLLESSAFSFGDLADWLGADKENLTEHLLGQTEATSGTVHQMKDFRHTQTGLPASFSGNAGRDSAFAGVSGNVSRKTEAALTQVDDYSAWKTRKNTLERPRESIDRSLSPVPPNRDDKKRPSLIQRARSRGSTQEFSDSPRGGRLDARRSTNRRPTFRKSTTSGLSLSTDPTIDEKDKIAAEKREKEMLKAFGRRHRALIVPHRAEARTAYMEAVTFSEAFAEQLPDALAGEGLGPPPETLDPGPRRWGWELQRLVIALAADRLGAHHDGVFDHPADRNDVVGVGRRTAAVMMPLILAAVGLLWRVPLWQRSWLLVHAKCLAKKLVEVIGPLSEHVEKKREIVLNRQRSRAFSDMGPDTEEVSSGRSSLCSSRSCARSRWPFGPWLPQVQFAKDHRLWFVNPSAEETDHTPIVAGVVTASNDIYNLDDGRELDAEEAVPVLGLPCANLGLNIEQGRKRRRCIRRRPLNAEGSETPAASRKRAFHHINEVAKAGKCLTGKVLDAFDVWSPQVSVSERKALDCEKAQEFSFTCGNYMGRGFVTLNDNIHSERIMKAAEVIELLERAAKINKFDAHGRLTYIEKHVKHTWSYRSFDESHIIFGSGAAEAKSCLQKLMMPAEKKGAGSDVHRDGIRGSIIHAPIQVSKGNAFPGTLSYMVYHAEVAIESVFVDGEAPEEAQVEVSFSGKHFILPPTDFARGGHSETSNDPHSPHSPRRHTGHAKSKDKDKGVVTAELNFKLRATQDVDIYAAGARLRIFRDEDLLGCAGTIMSLCETGEYLMRLDGGGDVIRFDPCRWNCEPAGVFRYEKQQKLMFYDDGKWVNATVTNDMTSNSHELEVPCTYRPRKLAVELSESNHCPAWMSVLDFERAARKYASEIRSSCGFLVDPVSGHSLDVLTLPCSIAFKESHQADALPELLKIVEPATDRHRGVLEAQGIIVWGAQSLGKTTLSKRLAVTCSYKAGGYLPIMVPVQDIMSFVEHDADPLDTLLWDRYGGTNLNLETYKLLRQALYCRRALIIFDGADASSAKFFSFLAFFQSLVDLGHRTLLFARPCDNNDQTLRPSNRPSFSARQKTSGSLSRAGSSSALQRAGSSSALQKPSGTLSRAGSSTALSPSSSITLPQASPRVSTPQLGTLSPRASSPPDDAKLPPLSDGPRTTVHDMPDLPILPDNPEDNAQDSDAAEDSDVARIGSISALVAPKIDALLGLVPREKPAAPSPRASAALKSPSLSAPPPAPKASVSPPQKASRMTIYSRSTAAAKEKATAVLLQPGTPPLLELELILLTPEVQHEAISIRCGDHDDHWLKKHLHAANDISEHPFGLMLLLGHVLATQRDKRRFMRYTLSHRASMEDQRKAAERSPSCLMTLLQSAITMCLEQALNQSLSVGISRQPCNIDDCLRLLEIAALELQRRGKEEIPKQDIEDALHHEPDERQLKVIWRSMAAAIEDQRMQILQGSRGLLYVHELCSARSPVRFIHSSFQEYFLARCCVRYISSQRPLGLPPFEDLLFEQSWERFFRYFFELLEIHKVSTTLDFSGRDLNPERFEKLIDFFAGRDWGFPCVKLELSGSGQVPSSNHLQRLLQTSVKALQGFSIRCYPLEAEGVSVFANALSQNQPTLAFLDLRNCSVGREGVRLLSEVLARNALLVHLNLAGNSIGAHGAGHLGVALQTNTKLRFLELENNGLISTGAAALSKCVLGCANSALKYLGIAHNRITDEGAVHVVELMRARWRLRELDIAGNSMQVAGFQRLANGMVADMTLRQLCLSGNEGGPDGMWHISKALRMLQGSSALRRIHLDHTRLGFEGISYLAEVIMDGATFECLELRGNRLGGKGVSRLSAALRIAFTKGSTKLQRLGLRSNSCMDEGAIAVAAVLKDARGMLEDLDLSENQIGDLGASEIANALKLKGACASRCLRKLKLNANCLSHQGVEALAQALTERRQSKVVLRTLELSGNIIGDDGAIAVASALLGSPALRIVELQRARIGADGAAALVHAVGEMKSIQRLGLNGNFLGDEFQRYAEDLCKIRLTQTVHVAGDASAVQSQGDLQMKWVTEFQKDVADERDRLGLPKVPPMSKYRSLLEGIVSLPGSTVPKADLGVSRDFMSRRVSNSRSSTPLRRMSSGRTSAKTANTSLEPVRGSKLPRPSKSVPPRASVFGKPTSPPSRNTSIASTKASTESSRFNI